MTIPPIDAVNVGGVVNFGSYLFVLVKDTGNHWDIVDTVIHESVHVFQKAMEYCQEKTPGIETQAYFTAAIATNLLKDFDRARSVKEN